MKFNKELIPTFIFSIILFIVYTSYFKINNSAWARDGMFMILLLVIVFLVSHWFLISKVEFRFIIFGLVLHSLGGFGFYELNFSFIGYDNIVHFYNSMIGAWIICDFLIHKLNMVPSFSTKKGVKREQKILFFILIVSFIGFLGVIIEEAEFFGYVFLGDGEGLFLTGAGDEVIYVDTMTDIIVNFMGAVVGALGYFKIRKRELLS